jgi:hypothetical protein
MERQINQRLPRPQASRVRRTLLMFLAFAYLFVGLAHTISCTDEAILFAISADTGTSSNDGPDEDGTKKSPVVAAHCYVCAPVLMPAVVPDAGPSARPVKLFFIAPALLLEEHPRLDTPPPKHLI